MREAPSPALNTSEEEDAAALEPTEDAAAPPTKRGRHRVLACATLASIINAFMFMNFSPIVELSRRRFRVSEGQVSWLYSAALLATLLQCEKSPSSTPPLPPLRNRYFALRHGQSESNLEGVISSLPATGTSIHGLTPLGRLQARRAATS